MKNMKYLWKLVMVIALALSGCGKKQIDVSGAKNEMNVAEGKEQFDASMTSYKEKLDNITIDAEVLIPSAAQSGEAPIANGESLDLKKDIEQLKSDFFSECNPNSLTCDEIEDGFFSIENSEVSDEWVAFAYNNSSSISINSANAQHKLNCIVRETYDEGYNGNLYQQKENLSFMSQKEAADKAREVFRQYGIELGDLVNVYVMDYETMEEQEDTTGSDGENDDSMKKNGWSQEDDTYYMFFHQMFQKYPVIYQPYAGMGFSDGEAASVMLDQDGIIEADIEGCFSWDVKETQKIISLQEAVNTFEKNYGGILEIEYNIDKISLLLDIIPENQRTAKLRPVWYFQGKMISGADQVDTAITIDAVNGQEIMS